jgi:dTDP-4-amino-4,6-dideoxygalactose transaminase
MPAVLALRREQAWRYAQLLAGSPWLHGWVASATPPTQVPTLLRFPVAVRHPSQRPALCAGLRALGIEPGEWFDDVVHPAGSQGHGYTPGDCPRGEWLAKTLVNLPLGLHAQWTASQWAGLRRLAQQAPAEGVADVGAGPMAGGPGP